MYHFFWLQSVANNQEQYFAAKTDSNTDLISGRPNEDRFAQLQNLIRTGDLVGLRHWNQKHIIINPKLEKLIVEETLSFSGQNNAVWESTRDLNPIIFSAEPNVSIDIFDAERIYLRHFCAYRKGKTTHLKDEPNWGNWNFAENWFGQNNIQTLAIRCRLDLAWDYCIRGRPKTCISLLPLRSLSHFEWDGWCTAKEYTARYTSYLLLGDKKNAELYHQKVSKNTPIDDEKIWQNRRELSLAIEFEQEGSVLKILEYFHTFQSLEKNVSLINQCLILRHKVEWELSLHLNEAAEESIYQFEDLRKQAGLKEDFANMCLDICELSIRKKQSAGLVSILQKELNSANADKNTFRLTRCYFGRAKLALFENRFDDAKLDLEICLRYATEEGLARWQAQACLFLWAVTLRQAISSSFDNSIATVATDYLHRCASICSLSHFPRTAALAKFFLSFDFYTSKNKPELNSTKNLFSQKNLANIERHQNLIESINYFCHLSGIQNAFCVEWKEFQKTSILQSFVDVLQNIKIKNLIIWDKNTSQLTTSKENYILGEPFSGIPQLFDAFFDNKSLSLSDIHKLQNSSKYNEIYHIAALRTKLSRLRACLVGTGLSVEKSGSIEKEAGRYTLKTTKTLVQLAEKRKDLSNINLKQNKTGFEQKSILYFRKSLLDFLETNEHHFVLTTQIMKHLNTNRQRLHPYLVKLEEEGYLIKLRRGPKPWCDLLKIKVFLTQTGEQFSSFDFGTFYKTTAVQFEFEVLDNNASFGLGIEDIHYS